MGGRRQPQNKEHMSLSFVLKTQPVCENPSQPHNKIPSAHGLPPTGLPRGSGEMKAREAETTFTTEAARETE